MAPFENLSARRRLGRSAAPNFFWDPFHISKINGVRNLKFGILVDICEYSAQKKNFALGGVWEFNSPNFYFGTPSIYPKLMELGS